MATIPVPTLSAAGWVRSAAEKADTLMSHWFESDKSQTLIYGTQVSSCAYIIQSHAGDPVATMSAMRAELEKYLGRYYDAVMVDTRAPQLLSNPNPMVEIKLFIQVTEGGQIYSFGKLLSISNSKLAKVLALNNEGEPVAQS